MAHAIGTIGSLFVTRLSERVIIWRFASSKPKIQALILRYRHRKRSASPGNPVCASRCAAQSPSVSITGRTRNASLGHQSLSTALEGWGWDTVRTLHQFKTARKRSCCPPPPPTRKDARIVRPTLESIMTSANGLTLSP